MPKAPTTSTTSSNVTNTSIQYYLVGGAVRDRLLGRPVKDRDWVVTGATPEDMQQRGFRPVGKDFPVFLHPDTHEEYALARTERKTASGYHGFQFHATPDVTLKDDLRRRDLSINALAEDATGHVIDYYNGQQDLADKYLRHVSDAFTEDPVRVLRVARFYARYANDGFRIAPETQQLMQAMVKSGEVDSLVPERVWQEMSKALTEERPDAFIAALRDCGALAVLLPELDKLFGIPQNPQHHPEIDTGVHTLLVLQQAVKLSPQIAVRFAALLHDLGKGTTPPQQWPHHPQHDERGVALVTQVCERYRVPNEIRQLAALATRLHIQIHCAFELDAEDLLSVLERSDAFRKPERFQQLLCVCQADSQGRKGLTEQPYPQADFWLSLLKRCQQVDVQKIIAAGYKHAAIKVQLRQQRLTCIQEKIHR